MLEDCQKSVETGGQFPIDGNGRLVAGEKVGGWSGRIGVVEGFRMSAVNAENLGTKVGEGEAAERAYVAMIRYLSERQ